MSLFKNQKVAKVLGSTLVATIFLGISVFGVAKALSQFQMNLKTDPAYHNLVVVATPTSSQFVKMVGETSQPVLDYVLRRVFYFPLFGENERTIKLPCFVSWILLSLLAPWLTFRSLVKKGEAKETLAAVVATAAISIWIANLPILVQYASEGRHYEWCALISLLWFSVYGRADYFKLKRFHCLSLVYLSSHFFAWPLVGSAYGYQAIKLVRNKKLNKELFFCLGLTGVVFLISISLNWLGIKALLNWDSSMGISNPRNLTESVLRGVLSGFSLLRMFRSVFEVKYVFFVIALIGASLLKPNRKFFYCFGSFLLTLFAISSSSSFSVLPRYIIPFFGMAWFIVVEAARAILEVMSRLERVKIGEAFRIKQIGILVSVLVIVSWAYEMSPASTFQAAFRLGIPGENFSDEFVEYEKIKKLETPSIVIGKGAYPYSVTLWYLRDQSKQKPHVSSLSQDIYHADTWKKLWSEFKSENPKGKTFVHFYTEDLCINADPKVFHELKRFAPGCIGEIVATDSVEKLEQFFGGLRG